MLARLPIDTRVRLSVRPNKVSVPEKVKALFESPERANADGQHVREGVFLKRLGLCQMGVFFADSDSNPTMTFRTFENHRDYVQETRLHCPDFRFFEVEMMVEACDGYSGPDGDFVADLKRRLQGWLRSRSTA